jgi:acyl carrier protein
VPRVNSGFPVRQGSLPHHAFDKIVCSTGRSGLPTPFIDPRMTFPQTELQREVAGLLVEALNLEMAPQDIDPDAPLYGEGLGLDSIDILEVALVVSQRYGFQLRSDDQNNVRIFTSLATLTEHIAAHRAG